ncbi:MAG: type II secretion system F family protein [Blastocatellia bacterium]
MEFIIGAYVFVLVVLLVVGVYWFFLRQPDPATARLKALNQQENPQAQVKTEPDLTRLAQQMAQPIQRLAPPSAEEAKRLQKKLMHAGYLNPNAVIIYRGLQFFLLLGFPLVTIFILVAWGRAVSDSYSWLLGALLLGYVIPRQMLDNKIKNRQQRLRWGLTDALDLLVISVEAGLSLNPALVRVGQELKNAHPDISQEFDLVNVEIQMGRERALAFRNLAERTGVEDMRSFCAMLIQADRFGSSIAQTLRNYADNLRVKRRQRAEQMAQKAAVKLLLPLALFLFPTLFIIILGPAAIHLMREFVNK